MPGYELQYGFDAWLRARKWLRLQWVDFDALARKWLRLQWLAAASMGWLRCLAMSYKVASTSMADSGFFGLTSMPGYDL